MRIPRTSLQACSSGSFDYIFAVGGLTEDGKATAIVERYNVH